MWIISSVLKKLLLFRTWRLFTFHLLLKSAPVIKQLITLKFNIINVIKLFLETNLILFIFKWLRWNVVWWENWGNVLLMSLANNYLSDIFIFIFHEAKFTLFEKQIVRTISGGVRNEDSGKWWQGHNHKLYGMPEIDSDGQYPLLRWGRGERNPLRVLMGDRLVDRHIIGWTIYAVMVMMDLGFKKTCTK